MPDATTLTAVMEITAHWEGGYRVRVPVRGFDIISDEPEMYGGTDAGPMPTELFVSSLAVCFTMAVYHAFQKRGVELPDLAVNVVADYEGLRFSRLRVEVRSSHPREDLEAILPRAINYCYVSNTLASNCDIDYVVGDGPADGPPRDQPRPPPS